MATNIKGELSEIKKGRYGIDIRIPIHDALAILAEGEFEFLRDNTNGEPINSPILSDYDITQELEIIDSEHSGALVKQAIRDALYKLSLLFQESKTVVTGLTGIDFSNPTEPSGPNYISSITTEYGPNWYSPNWQTLKTFLEDSELFDSVEFYQQSGVNKGVTVYVGDSPFVTICSSVYEPAGEDPVHYNKISVYNSDGETVFTYPSTDWLNDAISEAAVPTDAYRTSKAVLINCLSNAIMFCKNSEGGISVTFGCGYNLYPTDPSGATVLTDPSNRILTLTPDYEIGDYSGFAHSHSTPESSTVAALTALISEGDDKVSLSGYGVVTGYLSGTRADGVVRFGSKRLYVANSMLAIEI